MDPQDSIESFHRWLSEQGKLQEAARGLQGDDETLRANVIEQIERRAWEPFGTWSMWRMPPST